MKHAQVLHHVITRKLYRESGFYGFWYQKSVFVIESVPMNMINSGTMKVRQVKIKQKLETKLI